eukprot:CAMPEP_0202757110 /NCGR_PEP_ID=MMETSP1388-20130828/16158_1 /ASSEMBLY_ACC=CAM_ASM_000864 /TAXON_ID=37098 /ORGANISM="Isochrysis sp, Strain CCMP1244" /LENGTH=75 /DNA_ID=CAMNT_0049424993 /DNA_START=29 /DNA_END=253 /DNA_ORIENTATION=+
MSPAAIAAQPVNEKEGSPFDTGMQAIEWATAQVLSLPQLIPYSDEVISAARGVWTLDQNTGLSGHDDDDGGGNWQ